MHSHTHTKANVTLKTWYFVLCLNYVFGDLYESGVIIKQVYSLPIFQWDLLSLVHWKHDDELLCEIVCQ